MKALRRTVLTAMVIIFGSALNMAGASTMNKMDAHFAELGFSVMQDDQDRYGLDSVECVRNWSLYAEYYRQRNYDLAWDYWKYMYDDCPKATINIYLHGATMARYFYNNETDPERREAWIDTLLLIYDRRIEHFGNEGYVLGRKAVDMYQYRTNNVQDLFDLSERSIEMEGMSAEGPVLVINFHSTTRLVEAGLMDPEAVVERFDRAIDIIEFNLENNPEEERFYLPAKNNINAMFEPYATCESLVRVFGPRFEATPDDVELLLRITDMLDKSGCTGDELFYLATKQLHKIKPNAESAFLMGRLESNQDNYDAALNYFQQAADLYKDEDAVNNRDRIFRSYWLMAEISYRQLRRMPQARRLALSAHEANPTDGRPLILIGEMYAASASECGDDDLTKRAAYWPAVDKFIEARNIAEDPAVRERATQLINTFRQYFPDGETIFFFGFSEGEIFRVECWINETTRVRARP